MTQDPTVDRREQMLRAAVEIIGERGFPETRIADVAQRSGSSSALVLYYFGTKDTLLVEAMRYSEDTFYAAAAARLATLETPGARLELLIRMICMPDPDLEPVGSWGLWFDLWAQAFRHPEVAKDRTEYDQRWRNSIADVIRDGQTAGEFGPADPAHFALCLSALLDGLTVQVALSDPAVDSQRAYDIAMEYSTQQLGVTPGGSAPRRRRKQR